MKRCSMWLISRENQIKTTISITSHLSEWILSKKTSIGENVEKGEFLCIVYGIQQLLQNPSPLSGNPERKSSPAGNREASRSSEYVTQVRPARKLITYLHSTSLEVMSQQSPFPFISGHPLHALSSHREAPDLFVLSEQTVASIMNLLQLFWNLGKGTHNIFW